MERRVADRDPRLSPEVLSDWHAMGDGTLPKIAAFYDPIATVKAKYPKG